MGRSVKVCVKEIDAEGAATGVCRRAASIQRLRGASGSPTSRAETRPDGSICTATVSLSRPPAATSAHAWTSGVRPASARRPRARPSSRSAATSSAVARARLRARDDEDDEALWTTPDGVYTVVWAGGTLYGYAGPVPRERLGGWL